MSSSSPQTQDAGRRDLFRWQGVLGKLGRYPLLTAGTALLCVLVIGAIAYAFYPQLAAEFYHWPKAQQAIEKHDFDAAKRHLDYCLKVWPTRYETRFAMARACRRNDEYESAWRHLRLAEQLPHAVKEELDLEQLLLKAHEGRVRDVEETLQNYLERQAGPETANLILEALARGHYNTYRLREADRWLSIWVQRDADSWAPYYWRGKTLETNGQAAVAVAEYRAALERRPGHAETTLRLAACLLAAGLQAEALPHYQEYVRLSPADPAGVVGAARCRHELGDSQAAETELRRLLARHPDYPGALHLLALVLRSQERRKEAIALLQQAKNLAPFEIDITLNLAQVLHELGRDDEALKHEQDGKRLTEDFRELRRLRDKILDEPRNPDLRYQTGVILMRVGQEFGGATWLLTALQEDSRHAPSHKLLAEYFEKNGDQEKAEYHRRRAGKSDEAKPERGKP